MEGARKPGLWVGEAKTMVWGGRGDLSALPWLRSAEQHLGFLALGLPN